MQADAGRQAFLFDDRRRYAVFITTMSHQRVKYISCGKTQVYRPPDAKARLRRRAERRARSRMPRVT